MKNQWRKNATYPQKYIAQHLVCSKYLKNISYCYYQWKGSGSNGSRSGSNTALFGRQLVIINSGISLENVLGRINISIFDWSSLQIPIFSEQRKKLWKNVPDELGVHGIQ